MYKWMGLVKIARLVPCATFWKTPLFSSKRGIIIKYQEQLKFIYYHISGDKNICQSVYKLGITGKWNICWVEENGQDFGNFEEPLFQAMLFDAKT